MQHYERLYTSKLAPNSRKLLAGRVQKLVSKPCSAALFGPLWILFSRWQNPIQNTSDDQKLVPSTRYKTSKTTKRTRIDRIHTTDEKRECEYGNQPPLVYLRPERSHDGDRVNELCLTETELVVEAKTRVASLVSTVVFAEVVSLALLSRFVPCFSLFAKP